MSAAALKKKLKQRQLTIGSWLSFSFTPVCEMMGRTGFEWLVVDMEHTAISVAQQLQLIQIIDLMGISPLVRVGANDPLLIKQALDAGAHGIIVPMVNSEKEAMQAVSAAYYPPMGQRGAGLARAQDYGTGFAAYKERADAETIVIVQIEHYKAVEALEDILSVEGVDGFIVGPYDLSGSLGSPGDWSNPKVKQALAHVEDVAKQGRKAAGFHVVHSDHDELKARIAAGYTFIAYGGDMVFLAEKLAEERDFLTSWAAGDR